MKDIVLCDLDGTIALIEHRLHHVREDCNPDPANFKPNWDAFFAACKDDLPNKPVIRVIQRLSDDLRIWITSGRSEDVRAETMLWLRQHKVPCDNLLMRPSKDQTPDDKLKASWIERGLIDVERVLCVFEDRKRVVDMWRKHGLTCFHVAEGEF